jgi:hypothetical protein
MIDDGVDDSLVARFIKDHCLIVKRLTFEQEHVDVLHRRNLPMGWDWGMDTFARVRLAGIEWKPNDRIDKLHGAGKQWDPFAMQSSDTVYAATAARLEVIRLLNEGDLSADMTSMRFKELYDETMKSKALVKIMGPLVLGAELLKAMNNVWCSAAIQLPDAPRSAASALSDESGVESDACALDQNSR